MFDIFVHNIDDCLKLQQTYLIELEKGKRIRYNRTEFGRNSGHFPFMFTIMQLRKLSSIVLYITLLQTYQITATETKHSPQSQTRWHW